MTWPYSQQIQNLHTALDSSSDWKRGKSMHVNLYPTEVVIQIKLSKKISIL
jgi:hypothetical protein